jgi:hypothetical protein
MGTARPRAALAVLSLLVLAVSLASPLEPRETVARFERLARALAGDPGYRAGQMGFWFDPEYAAFLEDVKRKTPERGTVAILVPRRPDLYLFQASYQLAPRRVVEERWKDEADIVATYRTEAARGPGGVAITGGQLWTR